MRFMIMVPSSAEAEAGVLPPKDQLEKMMAFNRELQKAGVMLDGAGLAPSSQGAKVVFGAAGKPKVIDGPFAEAKEMVAGYWLIETKSKQEAIEWASRAPFEEGVTLQIRQLHDVSEWPEELQQAAKL